MRIASGQGSDGFYQGLAEGGEQSGERDWLGIFGPGDAIHPDSELAGRGKRDANELDFEFLVPMKILDRNSQV